MNASYRRRAVRLPSLLVAMFLVAPLNAATPPQPVGLDRDGDKIADAKDACVDESGPANADAKKNGCPVDGIKTFSIRGNEILFEQKLQFAVGKPQLSPASDALLDDLAQVLATRGANVDLFEISVHSDTLGSEPYNVALTSGRAKAISDALQARGIAGAKLRTLGYGSACPIDPGTTPAAHAKNRRVEIAILKRGGKKTNAVVGCSAATAKGIVSPPVP